MRFLKFFGICFAVVGALGGFGTAIYHKEYFIGVCVLALAAMAFPTVKKWYKDITFEA